MKKSIRAADRINFEAYSKLSDSGSVSNRTQLPGSLCVASKRLLASVAAGSLLLCYGLSSEFFRSPSSALETATSADEANPYRSDPGTNRPSVPKLEPIVVKAEFERSAPRSPRMLGPKPKEIFFKGEYYYGKMCTRSPDGAWALHQTENFKISEVVRASDAIRDQLKDSRIGVHLFSHPSSRPRKLREGEIYTLRLIPSDKTWADLEQGQLFNVDGGELEFVGSIPESKG
jgi:hypothetical protein